MTTSPLFRQILVVSSPQLMALAIGAMIGYPTVLLNQFSSNTSSMDLDMDSTTWIASVHGIAGIPSALMPSLMQWKGRKFAFVLSSFLVAVGWILTSIATSSNTLIIGEIFQGLGSSSSTFVCLLAISEMVDPKFRSFSLVLFTVSQCIGLVLVTMLGYYLHWKTVSFIVCIPILVALLMGLAWPESPFWLAHIGDFDKCEEIFIWLRGSGVDALKELDALLTSQKEIAGNKRYHNDKERNAFKFKLNRTYKKVLQKDFYMPTIHIFLLMTTYYWSGPLVVYTYALDILKVTINIADPFIEIVLINIIIIVSCVNSIVLLRFFKNKQILLACGTGVTILLSFLCVWSYLSTVGMVPKDSIIFMCCLLALMMFNLSGLTTLASTVSTELIVVKHRELGGLLFIILTCTLRTSSLKFAPYLIQSIELWATFLIYAVVAFIGYTLVWLYIPETKGRTLMEIEEYYNYGYFKKKTIDGNLLGNIHNVTSE